MNENTPPGQGQVPDPNLTKIEEDLAQLQKQAQRSVPAPVVNPTPQPAALPTAAVPPQTPPVPQGIKKGSGGSLIKVGVVLLILALLAVGAYFFGSYITSKKVSSIPTPVSTQELMEVTTPTPDVTSDMETYTDEENGFSFTYSKNWELNNTFAESIPNITLTNIAEDHTIYVTVWSATGFGYCFKYGDKKQISVGGKIAETADGVGGTELCSRPETEMSSLGNTYVLIPLEKAKADIPIKQIHISYDYPLSDTATAKSNLDQILSTFKFVEATSSASPSASSRFEL